MLAPTMPEKKYNTNLASEFHVMAILHRLGHDAYLALGNKKGIDIVVLRKDGGPQIVEVKGLNSKKNDWLLSSRPIPDESNLFYALVCFEDKIEDVTVAPRVWVVPAAKIKASCKVSSKKNGGEQYYLSHKLVKEEFADYENGWHVLNQTTQSSAQDFV
jgi:hypothetical protein